MGPQGLTNAGNKTEKPESMENVQGKRASHLGSEMQPKQSHPEQEPACSFPRDSGSCSSGGPVLLPGADGMHAAHWGLLAFSQRGHPEQICSVGLVRSAAGIFMH